MKAQWTSGGSHSGVQATIPKIVTPNLNIFASSYTFGYPQVEYEEKPPPSLSWASRFKGFFPQIPAKEGPQV